MPWAAIHLSGVPLISFDVRSLNLLQRVLLVNDGTLTDALEIHPEGQNSARCPTPRNFNPHAIRSDVA